MIQHSSSPYQRHAIGLALLSHKAGPLLALNWTVAVIGANKTDMTQHLLMRKYYIIHLANFLKLSIG